MTRPSDSNKKKKKKKKKKKTQKKNKQKEKRTNRIVDFPFLDEQRLKLKESKKRDNYQNFAKELKNYSTWKWGWYRL